MSSASNSSIAVLGPGGVGGLLAATFEHSGRSVTVVARPDTAAVMGREGIELKSVLLGDISVSPRVVTELVQEVDYLFVATKATHLENALERIKARPRMVVPLLNGLDHIAVLRARFGTDRVVAATIRVESDRPAPGRIVHTSGFLFVEVAHSDVALRPELERIVGLLERAGVPAGIGVSEAQVMWSKLVRLNALACTTAASGKPVGYIRSDPHWRAALEGCAREAAAVAVAEGAEVNLDVALQELESVHSSLTTSMQRDLAAGREPEVEAIPGSVLRAAARHGIECPTVGRLAAAIAERAGLPPLQIGPA